MARTPGDCEGGPGGPPAATGATKGGSRHRRQAREKQLSVLIAEALEQKLVVTIGGRRRRITKREAMVAQLVDKSAAADLRAVKLLLDLQKQAEQKAGITRSAPEEPLDEADRRVVATLLERLGGAGDRDGPE